MRERARAQQGETRCAQGFGEGASESNPPEVTRVNREKVEETQRSNSDSEWKLARKSKRSERKDKGRARVKDTEGVLASSSDDFARLRRRRRTPRRVDEKKMKTRGRYRLEATSSESEPECDVRGVRRRLLRMMAFVRRKLRSWNLKFNGRATKKAAEKFLHQLDDCREGNQLTDTGMLGALPCDFTSEAATWFRLEKARICSWKALVKEFKRRYIGEYDRQDLLHDLRRRT